MRTTVTLDPDTEQLVRHRMIERGLSFKDALNQLIREGVNGPRARVRFRTQTASMGQSRANLDRALQVAGEIEDAELVGKARRGS